MKDEPPPSSGPAPLRARLSLRRVATLAATALLTISLTASGCTRTGWTIFGTAVVTAAVVSSLQPPPPRVVYVPEPRPGWEWQPGYWTRHDGEWEWVDGQWIEVPPHYSWQPTHWEQSPNGNWHLIPGRWLAI